MLRYRLTERGMRETDDPPHPLDWVSLDECQRAIGALEAELAKAREAAARYQHDWEIADDAACRMEANRDKLAQRVKVLEMALSKRADCMRNFSSWKNRDIQSCFDRERDCREHPEDYGEPLKGILLRGEDRCPGCIARAALEEKP